MLGRSVPATASCLSVRLRSLCSLSAASSHTDKTPTNVEQVTTPVYTCVSLLLLASYIFVQIISIPTHAQAEPTTLVPAKRTASEYSILAQDSHAAKRSDQSIISSQS